jgi:hypothetical protein
MPGPTRGQWCQRRCLHTAAACCQTSKPLKQPALAAACHSRRWGVAAATRWAGAAHPALHLVQHNPPLALSDPSITEPGKDTHTDLSQQEAATGVAASKLLIGAPSSSHAPRAAAGGMSHAPATHPVAKALTGDVVCGTAGHTFTTLQLPVPAAATVVVPHPPLPPYTQAVSGCCTLPPAERAPLGTYTRNQCRHVCTHPPPTQPLTLQHSAAQASCTGTASSLVMTWTHPRPASQPAHMAPLSY